MGDDMVFSAKKLAAVRKRTGERVTAFIENRQGDTVKIIKEPEISVSAYKRGTVISPQDLDDEDFSLVIDKANYFAFKIDDIEEAHS